MITLASLSETTSGIVEKFGIDWPLLVAQGFNFILVAVYNLAFWFKESSFNN